MYNTKLPKYEHIDKYMYICICMWNIMHIILCKVCGFAFYSSGICNTTVHHTNHAGKIIYKQKVEYFACHVFAINLYAWPVC